MTDNLAWKLVPPVIGEAKTPIFRYLDAIHLATPFRRWQTEHGLTDNSIPSDLMKAIVEWFVVQELPFSFKEVQRYTWAAALRYDLVSVDEVVDGLTHMEGDF